MVAGARHTELHYYYCSFYFDCYHHLIYDHY